MLVPIFMVSMEPKNAIHAQPSNEDDDVRNWHAFEGPAGYVLHNGRSFFAWKEGRLIGAYRTLEEAMESLGTGERVTTLGSK
jgi:hypothetical protein